MADNNNSGMAADLIACARLANGGIELTGPKGPVNAADYAIQINADNGACTAKKEPSAGKGKSLYAGDVPVGDPVSPSPQDTRPAQPYLNSRPVPDPAPKFSR